MTVAEVISENCCRRSKAGWGTAGSSRYFKHFGDSMEKMTGEDPRRRPWRCAVRQGFPVLDMQKVSAIPGIDPAMLQFLPKPSVRRSCSSSAVLRGSRRVAKPGDPGGATKPCRF